MPLFALATLTLVATSLSGALAQNCYPVAQGAIAPNPGVYATPGDEPAYAFEGRTAPKNGAFCEGCAIVNAGVTAPIAGVFWQMDFAPKGAKYDAQPNTPNMGSGIFCSSSGCVDVPNGATAPSDGVLYSPVMVGVGTISSELGVFCPGTAQSNGCAANTCEVRQEGDVADCLGTACSGTDCMAVVNGIRAPVTGVYCSGCQYADAGNRAPFGGTWWSASAVDRAGYLAPSDGLFCPNGFGDCVAVSRGDTSPSAGTFYSSEAVAGGAVNSKPGVFCPSSDNDHGHGNEDEDEREPCVCQVDCGTNAYWDTGDWNSHEYVMSIFDDKSGNACEISAVACYCDKCQDYLWPGSLSVKPVEVCAAAGSKIGTSNPVSGNPVRPAATTYQIMTSTYDNDSGDGKNCNGIPIHSGIASLVLLETKSTTEFTGCATHSAGVQKQTMTCFPDGSYSMSVEDCTSCAGGCTPSGTATVFAAEAAKAKTGACYELTWTPPTGGFTTVYQKISSGFDFCAMVDSDSASSTTVSLAALVVAVAAAFV